MGERLEPVIPESPEVVLQGYLEVFRGALAELAANTNTPSYLLYPTDEFGRITGF